jgi:hypothetical protein
MYNGDKLGDAKSGVERAISTLKQTLEWQKTLRDDVLNYLDPPLPPRPSAAPLVLPGLLLGLTTLLFKM